MTPSDFEIRKLLVANRGVAAVRILKTCRELGIPSVAIHSTPDRGSAHLGYATECVELQGASAEETYANPERVVDAARRAGCDALHPGYGFLSEDADFAELCGSSGLTFVGPSPMTLALTRNKAACLEIVRAVGVPALPGGVVREHEPERLEAIVRETGLPVMVKPANGAGGLGSRIVSQRSELDDVVASVSAQAAKLFRDGAVLVERFVPEARHIEVQIAADSHGSVVHFYERECSLQRHHQKVIEEAPSPNLSSAARETVVAFAADVARALDYVGIGTVEFLFDGTSYYFLEVNPRLQVEHGITELTTGVDFVALQLRIAARLPLGTTQSEIRPTGYAVEARVYAEDPVTRLPTPGVIQAVRLPSGHGVRVDTFVLPGTEITSHYDPMLANVMAHGVDKPTALRRLAEALRQVAIVGDLRTNIPLLLQILEDPRFQDGGYHTDFLTRKHFNIAAPDEELRRLAALAASFVRSTASEATPATTTTSGWRGGGWRGSR
jgi:acetyl/propionyl-CoA carboxylase alpha subunit